MKNPPPSSPWPNRVQATLLATLLCCALPCGVPYACAGSQPATFGSMRFERNVGQFDAPVRYLSRGADRTLFLAGSEVVLALHAGDGRRELVRMTFHGGRTAGAIDGEDRLDSATRYSVGRDPSHWRDDVPSYSKVRYREVYAGIDVVFHGRADKLEYDFELAPGADARAIDLEFDGAAAPVIDAHGDLVLHTPLGDLRQDKPLAYQTVGGDRRTVPVRFVRRAARRIGIEPGRYDHTKALVVDPLVLFHATYLGGSASDKALAVAVDGAGNTYLTGLTQSVDFPTANAAQPASGGATDVFVSKIDPAGTALIYTTYLGGAGIDAGQGIAIDAGGSAYVTGYTGSANFPVTANALQATLKGAPYDAFVARLGPDGSLSYSTYLGGSDLDVANAIAVDTSGSAYVAGYTCSPDFPTLNAFQPSLNGPPYGCFAGRDAFVSKIALGTPGAPLAYSTYFGGSAEDSANAIAVDWQGRASITGTTWSSDLPTSGLALRPYLGSADAFVARFASAGSLDYSSFFGGSGKDEGTAIAADAADDVFIAGRTESTDFPTANAFQTDLHGPADAFVARIRIPSPSTAVVGYASYLGGRDDDGARAIVIDASRNAYVTGYTPSIDFPLKAPIQPMLAGAQDAFVGRITPNGVLAFSTYFGGDDLDDGWGIGLSSSVSRGIANIHVAGVTYSTDLATQGVLQPALQGAPDAFVAMFGFVP
jgi:Beta-propeller repeat